MNYRIVLFAFAMIFGIVFSMPSILQSEQGKKITLGLDLQGGLHMLLGVEDEVAVESKIKSIASAINYTFNEEDVIFDNLRKKENLVEFEILDNDDILKVDNILKKEFKGTLVNRKELKYTISLTEEEITKTKEMAISQAVDVIRNRLDSFGLAEPTVAKQGKDKILVEVPGIKTQEDEQRVRELIARAAHLQLMAVDEERSNGANNKSKNEIKSYGDVLLPDIYDNNKKYLVKEIPILDGSMLTDARVGFDKNNQPVINFSLNNQGARIFGDFTAKSVGKRMAVVLDNKVYSAPNIRERIGGGHVQISGSFSINEASDLAVALRSGALLAPVYIMEKRSIGPSLGADSIRSSSLALAIGFIAVIMFMFIYYGISGAISNVALIVNLFLILAVMSLFGATLTLPGMAGIVLTVGMAVDANVIINERIREFLKEGKSITKSIEMGYDNALSAIMDANITTLIAATVLYVYGTGAIKGFALTMSIGILASMLTAIVGTHGIYQLLNKKIKKDNLNIWFGIKGEKK